ncbi:MAG: hypothetical protein DRP56_06120 [Planctomycetota bacterium]|nr:MAG: hypothetical protein DRP56_06120 [Planctomycetota bacterium]
MKMRNKNKAFTLIELLVVISIIAMLVAILSVAQKKVKLVSKNLKQKAAFHAGEISLELFSKDFGDYPDSSQIVGAGGAITGAQRIAEAFFGRDDRGFNPKTKWHPGRDALVPQDIYTDLTLKDRKKPYFQRKRVGFYTVYDLWAGNTAPSSIYSSGAAPASATEVTPIFTDVFLRNKVTLASGERAKVGMPILYFKADSTKKFRVDAAGVAVDPITNANSAAYSQWVYNFQDNLPILQLPWLRDTTAQPNGLALHYPDKDGTGKDNAQIFYEQLTQRQDGNFFKPYNKSTFILISAGYDGIYGTKDDLTNFDN